MVGPNIVSYYCIIFQLWFYLMANYVYECGEDADTNFVTKQAKKLLCDTQIVHNAGLSVEDFMQELHLQITIIQDDTMEDNEFEVFPFRIPSISAYLTQRNR